MSKIQLRIIEKGKEVEMTIEGDEIKLSQIIAGLMIKEDKLKDIIQDAVLLYSEHIFGKKEMESVRKLAIKHQLGDN